MESEYVTKPPKNDGSFYACVIGLRKNQKHRCTACGFRIRDRRPGPLKRNRGVIIDSARVGLGLAYLCYGCAIVHYPGLPAFGKWNLPKTLAEAYWPEQWTEETNVA